MDSTAIAAMVAAIGTLAGALVLMAKIGAKVFMRVIDKMDNIDKVIRDNTQAQNRLAELLEKHMRDTKAHLRSGDREMLNDLGR